MSIRNLFKYVRTKDENLNKALLSAKDQFDVITRAVNTGTDPAAHILVGPKHTGSGLTIGHFLKALGATTFGFAAHGLGPGDVGAPPTARAISTNLPLGGGGDLSTDRALSLAGLAAIGTPDHLVKVNHAGTGWEYQSKYIVDVRDFGAVGWPTDDSAAIQAAISSLPAYGGTVVFSLPHYKVTTGLVFSIYDTNGSSVRLIGVYPRTRIVFTPTTGNLFTIAPTHAGYYHYFDFENLWLYGPGATSGDCIHADGAGYAVQVEWKNLLVENFGGGNGIYGKEIYNRGGRDIDINTCSTGLRLIDVANANNFYNLKVQYNKEYGAYLSNIAALGWFGGLVQGNEKHGLYINGLDAAVFSQVYFEDNNSSDTGGKYALFIEGSSGKANRFLTFDTCSFVDTAVLNSKIYLTAVSGYLNNDIVFLNCRHGGQDGNQIEIMSAYNGLIQIMGGAFVKSRIYVEYPQYTSLVHTGYDYDTGLADFSSFLGNKRWSFGVAAPTTGTWGIGDICWHTDAASGEPLGWYCTVAGTPGTWKAFGTLA